MFYKVPIKIVTKNKIYSEAAALEKICRVLISNTLRGHPWTIVLAGHAIKVHARHWDTRGDGTCKTLGHVKRWDIPVLIAMTH